MSDIRHDGDCTIYAAMDNGRPTDGICTCGAGLKAMRGGDPDALYSKERLMVMERIRQWQEERAALVKELFGDAA